MSESFDHSARGEFGANIASTPPRRTRPRLLLTCLLVGVVVGAGAAAATWKLNHLVLDPTPKPRPWINAPYITTPHDVVEKMLEVAEVKEGELLYDLGCGDGRIAIAAAAKHGARARGYDIEAERIADSRANAKNLDVEDLVEFEQRDVFTLDLSDADVVAFYLLPRYIERLLPQFAEMRPGARIVSHDFFMEGIPPDKTVTITSPADDSEHDIHLWITPLKVPAKKS